MATADLLEQVRERLAEAVSPALHAHLGDIEATSIDADGCVHVQFSGACTVCAYRKMTLIGAVFPRIASIEGVTGLACDGVAIHPRELQRMLKIFGDNAERSVSRRIPVTTNN
jgi:Fe-S cluster biogenesis protein NfuA